MLEIKINESDDAARIIIVGVGGADNNAVSHMISENIAGVEFIGMNTDKQALQFCKAPTAIRIDEELTKGLGTGARSGVGEKAAEESSEEISQAPKGAGMVFVTCGMGGGTGTGAAPIVTKITGDMDILTVGVVTKPLRFEAKIRMNNALEGIESLKNSIDTLIMIPNDRLLEIVDRRTAMPDVLKKADEVLQQAVQGITDLINVPGLINLDFANVQTVMVDEGIAHIGIGKVKGDDKTIETVRQAVSSPLLEITIEGTSHMIINISGDISLIEANEAISYIQELAGDETNIIFGVMHNENAQDEVSITVVATGLDEHGANASVSNAMKGFTSNSKAKPSIVATAAQVPHAATPETTATAFSPCNRQSQGYTPSFDPSSSGSQGYNPPKYNPNQGYNAGSTQNPAPAPGQSFRPATSKEMQINIPDFLKNRR